MQHQNTQDRLIRRPEVRAATGLTDSAIDREIRAGRFPKPIQLIPGGRAVGWSERAIQAWISERIAAAQVAA